MKKHILFLGTILLSICVSGAAWCGTESHGGAIVMCGANPSQAVVLDYYHATLPLYGFDKDPEDYGIIDISNLSTFQTVNLFLSRLGSRYFAQQMREVMRIIPAPQGWIAADLKDLDDSNEPYLLPKGCALKTVAIRQGDHEMFIDPTRAHLLSPAQLGILYIHEIIYYIASHHGFNTSEGVRALIREVLQKEISEQKLTQLILDIGGVPDEGTMEDFLTYSRYTPVDPSAFNGDEVPVLYFTKKDYRTLTISREGVNQDLISVVICGGEPFKCAGHDKRNADLFLEIPDGNYRFLKLRWFYKGAWIETRFVALNKSEGY